MYLITEAKVPFNYTHMTIIHEAYTHMPWLKLLSVSLLNLFVVVMWSAKTQPVWNVMKRKMKHVSFNREIDTLVINGIEF
jgi:hypothetical protein